MGNILSSEAATNLDAKFQPELITRIVVEGLASPETAPPLIGEFAATLDALAEMGTALPLLPSSAFSSGSTSEDRN